MGVALGVVIPSFKVKRHILDVIRSIGSEVQRIYVVDDACPEGSGDFVEQNCKDPRVTVLRHARNQGVGGAVLTGYRAAFAQGMDIVIKVDGDGQMDPRLISVFVEPIVSGRADYTKGNRFYNLEDLSQMPALRLFGNAALSFLSKLSTGYWNLFDPTNGYTAIHARLIPYLPFEKISKRYFFETDLLFRLNTLQACVADIPMAARYGDEESNLRVARILLPFLRGHIKNTAKRIFYNYFLRNFSPASVELGLGAVLFLGGAIFGVTEWAVLAAKGEVATSGTVMLAALPVLIGFQLLLSAFNYDVQNTPSQAIYPRLRARDLSDAR